MNATKDQKIAIRRNAKFNEDIKQEWVQWATEDTSKTSLNDLTFEQAEKILAQQTGTPAAPSENWARFDKNNSRHKLILSLLRQAQWVTTHPTLGTVADLDRLSAWLKSDKSPVKKKLMSMKPAEVEKIIKALSGIVASTYK